MIGDIDSRLKNRINQLIELGEESLPSCTIINQDGEVSDTYRAFANGTYTFTVKDIVTGEIYEKSVQVTNIDNSMEYYYIDFESSFIYLLDKTNNHVDFQNAYIIYNEERIDITSCIVEDEGDFFVSILSVARKLENMGKVEYKDELSGTIQTFELIKDGKSYFGDVVMHWLE